MYNMTLYRTLLMVCFCCTNAVWAQQKVAQPKLFHPMDLTVNTFNPEKKTVVQPLSSAFYTQHLAFFCRQELKLEHIVHTPVKIRAGSVDACNYLEQKPGYQYLNR